MTKLHTAQRPVPTSTLGSRLRLTPLAYALTTMLMAGAFTTPARAQQAFSGGWFAAKGAAQNTAASSGRLPNGQPSPLGSRPEGQRANEPLQRSLNNLNLAARAIAAQQAARAGRRILRRALGREPAAAERLLRAGRRAEGARHQHGGQCVSKRRKPQAAAQRGRGDWALGSVKLGHGNGFLAREKGTEPGVSASVHASMT